jgi:SAM-dependent methyltransferase
MRLLDDDELGRSAVVANCRMNRERNLLGSNGYDRELAFNPLDFLKQRIATGQLVTWLDLCCGTGRALIQAARQVRSEGLVSSIEILGVDLVGLFDPNDSSLSCLRLVEASLSNWRPHRSFDLITCVHGLHYVGDKIGLIARAASWLLEDGLFVANLDLNNICLSDGKTKRTVVAKLRGSGLEYDRRKRRIVCKGGKRPALPFRYLGADDRVGPNYTGQPAVTSHYEYLPIGAGSVTGDGEPGTSDGQFRESARHQCGRTGSDRLL